MQVTTALVFFFQAEDGIRDIGVTGVQTCALPILGVPWPSAARRELVTKALWAGGADGYAGARIGELSGGEIGRASCRERVEISVVAVSLKKKKNERNEEDIVSKSQDMLCGVSASL